MNSPCLLPSDYFLVSSAIPLSARKSPWKSQMHPKHISTMWECLGFSYALIKCSIYVLPTSLKHKPKRILPGKAEHPSSPCSLLIPSLDPTAVTPPSCLCCKQNLLRGNVSRSLYLPPSQLLLKLSTAPSCFQCYSCNIQSPDKSLTHQKMT